MRISGHYEKLGNIKYFIPKPLPPQNPSFSLNPESAELYGQTMHNLGKLNGIASKLPDASHFINSYVIKEALLSSSIEGIHATLLDVFTQPLLETKPNKDTQLVMNYKKALDCAIDMISNQNLPICSRVILKAHETLMRLGDGDKSDPGHFRKQSVHVGNLIPAPAPQIPHLMQELEEFINTNETISPLVQAGLAHVQFEIIHPFLDGNGRIGRLLIVLMLIKDHILSIPIIYPSYYFKKYQLEYYHRLDKVRTDGDFEGWIHFYLNVMNKSSIDAYRRAKDIETLHEKYSHLITQKELSVKKETMWLQVLETLFSSPVINITALAQQLTVSYNTASSIITHFIALGLLLKDNEQKRGKLFRFQGYLDLLEREYD